MGARRAASPSGKRVGLTDSSVRAAETLSVLRLKGGSLDCFDRRGGMNAAPSACERASRPFAHAHPTQQPPRHDPRDLLGRPLDRPGRFWRFAVVWAILRRPKRTRQLSERAGYHQNFLLAALPAADSKRFAARLRLVRLFARREGLQGRQPPSPHAYFPTTSIVSLVAEMPNGDTAEIAITGNDGMVGTPLMMGALQVAQRCDRAVRRQSPTGSRRVPSRAELDRNGASAQLDAALRPGADDADDPDGRVQPASPRGAATVPLAPIEPGPPALERRPDD